MDAPPVIITQVAAARRPLQVGSVGSERYTHTMRHIVIVVIHYSFDSLHCDVN